MAKGTRRARTGIALTALALSSGACILTETSRDHERRTKESTAPLATYADVTGLGADTIRPTRQPVNDFSLGDYGPSGDLAYDAAHDTFLISTQATGTDTPTVFTIGPVVVTAPRDGSTYGVHDVAAGPGEMPYFGRSYFDDATRKLYVLAESNIRGISEDRRAH